MALPPIDRKQASTLALALLLGVIGISMLIDWMVLTDEERIGILIQDCRDGFIEQDVDRVLGYLASNYASTVLTKPEIMRRVKMGMYDDGSARLGSVTFDHENSDLAHARVTCYGSRAETGKEEGPYRLKIYFVRENEHWYIQTISLWMTGM